MGSLIVRDMRLAFRLGGGGGLALGFFAIAVALVPFGLGAELGLFSRIAPGYLWIAAALSVLLSLDRLFQADFEDGSLDMLRLSPLPLEGVAAAKCIAHWLTTGLPLVVMSPLLGLMAGLPEAMLLPLTLSLLIGTPALTAIGAIGAALTAGLRRGGLLMSLMVLPLYVPVLIFGAAAAGGGRMADFLLLTAATLFALVLAPVAAAAALRLTLD